MDDTIPLNIGYWSAFQLFHSLCCDWKLKGCWLSWDLWCAVGCTASPLPLRVAESQCYNTVLFSLDMLHLCALFYNSICSHVANLYDCHHRQHCDKNPSGSLVTKSYNAFVWPSVQTFISFDKASTLQHFPPLDKNYNTLTQKCSAAVFINQTLSTLSSVPQHLNIYSHIM